MPELPEVETVVQSIRDKLIGNEFELNSCLLRNLYPEKRNILGSIANSLPEILKVGLDNEPEQLKNILHVLNDAKQQEL